MRTRRDVMNKRARGASIDGVASHVLFAAAAFNAWRPMKALGHLPPATRERQLQHTRR
jgi:hypothetical protein